MELVRQKLINDRLLYKIIETFYVVTSWEQRCEAFTATVCYAAFFSWRWKEKRYLERRTWPHSYVCASRTTLGV